MEIEYKFESREAYLKWCDDSIRRIYYANIAMNNKAIQEVVADIQWRMHTAELEAMYP